MALCEKARGVVNVLVNGISLKLESDSELTIQPSNQLREEKSCGEFSVNERSVYIEGTFKVPSTLNIKEILELCGVPVTAEMYDGRVFHIRSAAQVSEEGYNAKEGTISLRFSGDFMEEFNENGTERVVEAA